MRKETLLRAAVEAERFLKLAREALAQDVVMRKAIYPGNAYVQASQKHTAAARRASMDLTRALADLRQGR